MKLGYGLISCQLTAGDPRTWEDLYREALDLTVKAEELGFASVWTTEHHFIDDGYMPSLLPMAAAMAARTERIEIGTGVLLAPLYHPLRLAEDAATVQLISGGRLLLGLGLGWSQTEFEAFGADIRMRGRAMEELLTLLPRAWAGEVLDHHGSVYDLAEVAVRPVPQRPPPIVIGGSADAAVDRAGRLADGFFSNAPPDKLGRQLVVARRALEDAGRDPDSFRWIYYGVMYPGPWGEVRDHLWLMRWKYSDMEASATRMGPLPAAPPPPDEEALQRAAFVGSPDEIVGRLHEIRESSGVALEFVARSYFQAMSYSQQAELLEILAAEVGPRL